MFIDCTRFGAARTLRLAVASIAYLDAVEGGCAIHLIGGETVRVNETVKEIEFAATPLCVISAVTAANACEADEVRKVLKCGEGINVDGIGISTSFPGGEFKPDAHVKPRRKSA